MRALVLACVAPLLVGAKAAPTVDYRLAAAPPALQVSVRLRGDPDGETRLTMPPGVSGLTLSGARATWADAGTLILQHRPGAKLALGYRIPRASGALTGRDLFAVPIGRDADIVTFGWTAPASEWTIASDLEAETGANPAKVADVANSVTLAAPDLQIVRTELPGSSLRVAVTGAPVTAAQVDGAQRLIAAEQEYWRELSRPAVVVLNAGASPSAADRVRHWIPERLGTGPAPAWFTDGLSAYLAHRLELRAALLSPREASEIWTAALSAPDTRSLALALKWDEDVRRATGGKADLDDVLLRMRAHARQFQAGAAPDAVTGLVSAAWVVAHLDLRGDIARYAASREPIPLPQTLFDRCIDVRPILTPAFDAGFDLAASEARKIIQGVRRGGPAWSSGLRNGMTLNAVTLTPGDTGREVIVKARDGRKRLRTFRYWPYGDAVAETRRLQFAVGRPADVAAACARKVAGL